LTEHVYIGPGGRFFVVVRRGKEEIELCLLSQEKADGEVAGSAGMIVAVPGGILLAALSLASKTSQLSSAELHLCISGGNILLCKFGAQNGRGRLNASRLRH